jgi:hypothetical protein
MIYCGFCENSFDKYDELPFVYKEGFAKCCPKCGICDYEKGADFKEASE